MLKIIYIYINIYSLMQAELMACTVYTNYDHRYKFMNHIFPQTQEVNYYCDLAQKLLSLARLLFCFCGTQIKTF